MTPFLALWRPDPKDTARFDRVVLVVEVMPANAPHSPHVADAVRARLWRASLGRFTPSTCVLKSGALILDLDTVKTDARIADARAALDAEGIELAS